MNATDVIRHYVDLWNGRDADALVGAFTKDGVYCNPDTDPGVSGEALATFAKGLWSVFQTLESNYSK
jgi:ketosteroid isomerase-like protein